MSSHFFEGKLRCTVRVRLGYERSRNKFFLEVDRIDAHTGQGHCFLYLSCADLFNQGDDLGYYREKLKKLGLKVPESLFRSVKEDAARGIDDRCAQHFANGRIVEKRS